MRGSDKAALGVVSVVIISLAIVLGFFFGSNSGDDVTKSVDLSGTTSQVSAEDRLVQGQIREDAEGAVTKEKVAPLAVEPLTEADRIAQEGAGQASLITGTVRSEFGEPLAGAEVTFKTDPTEIMVMAFGRDKEGLDINIEERSCQTQADGSFRLENVPVSEAALLAVSHADHVPNNHPLHKYDGGRIEVGEIVLARGGSLSGFVTSDRGQPIPSARVSAMPAKTRNKSGEATFIFPMGSGSEFWQAETGPDGFYRITGLPEGETQLHATHRAYLGETLSKVAVTKGKDRGRVNFKLQEGAVIGGRVVDEKDQPVAGARVRIDTVLELDFSDLSELHPGRMNPASVLTDEAGLFLLKGLEKGEHTVRITAPAFLPYQSAKVKTGTQDLVAVLERGGWVAGHVMDGKTGEKLPDFSLEVQQSGGLIFSPMNTQVLKGQEAVDQLASLKSPRGAFYIPGIREGTFELTCEATGYGETKITQLRGTPGAGEIVEVTLWPEARLAGMLFTAAGEPVGGGTLLLQEPTQPREGMQGGMRIQREIRLDASDGTLGVADSPDIIKKTKSQEDGTFLFEGVAEGDYALGATHPEHTDALPLEVTAARGETVTGLEVRLGASGSIKGRVYDVEGQPKPGIRVEAKEAGGIDFMGKTGLADSKGAYLIKGLDPGEYWVKLLEANDGPRFGGFMTMTFGDDAIEPPAGSYSAHVIAGEVTELDLYEIRKASIAGRVTEAGRPVPDMPVKLFKQGPMLIMPLQTVRTDGDGSYHLDQIQPGSYTLRIDPMGLTTPIDEELDLLEGAQASRNFTLASGRITGRITDLATGQPVEGARVSAEMQQETAPAGEAQSESRSMNIVSFTSSTTDDSAGGMNTITFSGGGGPEPVLSGKDGHYEIRFVADGNYQVKASGKGYSEAMIGPVEVAEAKLTAHQNLQLSRGFTVKGKVINARTGKPVSYCALFYSPVTQEENPVGDHGELVLSESDGSFVIKDLRAGTYRLTAGSDEYEGSLKFSLAKTDLLDQELRVSPR